MTAFKYPDIHISISPEALERGGPVFQKFVEDTLPTVQKLIYDAAVNLTEKQLEKDNLYHMLSSIPEAGDMARIEMFKVFANKLHAGAMETLDHQYAEFCRRLNERNQQTEQQTTVDDTPSM